MNEQEKAIHAHDTARRLDIVCAQATLLADAAKKAIVALAEGWSEKAEDKYLDACACAANMRMFIDMLESTPSVHQKIHGR